MKLPLRITRYAESFIIRDAHETSICTVFFDSGNDSERAIRKRMSEAEAEALAKRIARLLTDEEEKG
jgi:hypothetical protein